MVLFNPRRRLFTQQTAALGSAAALAALMPNTARAGEHISVTHWRVLMHGLPYAVALKRGFFKEAGVDVTGILSSKGGATTMRNVLAEGLPYGEVSVAAAIAAAKMDSSFKEDIEIRIVNAGVNSIGDVLWVTQPSSPIKSIKDLAGKTVGFSSPKSVTEMLLLMALEKARIKPESVKRVSTSGVGNGLKMLDQGNVDAVPVLEPIWSTVQSKYRAVFFVKDLLPSMAQTVGVTTAAFAASHGHQLQAVIAGRRKGVQFIYNELKETAVICAETYDLPLATAASVVNNLRLLRYWSEGTFDVGALNSMMQGMKLVGEIEQDVNWSKLLDPRFLPGDLRRAFTQQQKQSA